MVSGHSGLSTFGGSEGVGWATTRAVVNSSLAVIMLNLVISAIREAVDRFQPKALLVGESCTAELIQDQPGALAMGLKLPVPVVPLELPSYSKKENWGASETFYRLVRALAGAPAPRPAREPGRRPLCNILGPTALGFRHRDDVREITQLLGGYGIDVVVVAPLGARPADLQRIPSADANVNLYPEVAGTLCSWLERQFGMACTSTVPVTARPSGVVLKYVRPPDEMWNAPHCSAAMPSLTSCARQSISRALSAPYSMASAASDAVPTPASTMTGTFTVSMMILRL